MLRNDSFEIRHIARDFKRGLTCAEHMCHSFVSCGTHLIPFLKEIVPSFYESKIPFAAVDMK